MRPAIEGRHAGEFIVAIHQSQVLRVEMPFSDVLVGNSNIADVVPMTDRSVYVLGKALGTTSLTFYDRDKRLIAIADLTIAHDIDGLKARLFELMPDERIEVRPANDSLVLSGAVSSGARLNQILAVAERYAPGKISNLLAVKGSQQVLLAVRFAEVARDVIKDLDFSTNVLDAQGRVNFALSTGRSIPASIAGIAPITTGTVTSFAVGALTGRVGPLALTALFDALEQKGVVKTLAEPNLIALSGDTASFLAGGEFPIPVAQTRDLSGTTITIEFKQFGVSLSFTPTVLADGLINLVVSPEVSRIDRNNSVTLSGFVIPGLTTRRAKTTIELRDGESFAIAGLIQDDFQDTVRQFPLLGDVPILGALMRSADYRRNQSELVIVVTPHLVRPAAPDALSLPTDRFVPPSEADLFLFGRTEAPTSGAGERGARALSIQGAGGIDGPYGHIIK